MSYSDTTTTGPTRVGEGGADGQDTTIKLVAPGPVPLGVGTTTTVFHEELNLTTVNFTVRIIVHLSLSVVETIRL